MLSCLNKRGKHIFPREPLGFWVIISNHGKRYVFNIWLSYIIGVVLNTEYEEDFIQLTAPIHHVDNVGRKDSYFSHNSLVLFSIDYGIHLVGRFYTPEKIYDVPGSVRQKFVSSHSS